VAANQYGGAAAGTQIASSREVHWSPWPMGKDGYARFVTYFACSVASSQLWARHRSWLGGWSRCRARVSTGRSDIYRISDANATPTQAILNTFSPVERYHLRRSSLTVRGTVLPRFACQTKDCDAIPPPGALRAANRRTDLDMPKNQNQKIKPGFSFYAPEPSTPDFCVKTTPLTDAVFKAIGVE